MESTVDVFLIQEGREPNPLGKAYFTLPASESGAVLGLSDKLEYHASEMPPRFGPRIEGYGRTALIRPNVATGRAVPHTQRNFSAPTRRRQRVGADKE